MSKIKTSGEKITTTSKLTGAVQQIKATEDTACTVLGFTISTGAQFVKRFATVNMAQQWLLTGDAADIEISQVTL